MNRIKKVHEPATEDYNTDVIQQRGKYAHRPLYALANSVVCILFYSFLSFHETVSTKSDYFFWWHHALELVGWLPFFPNSDVTLN